MARSSLPSVNQVVLNDVVQSIKQVGEYGSVEIYIQDHLVTQITVRQIHKTSVNNSNNGYKHKSTLDKPYSIY